MTAEARVQLGGLSAIAVGDPSAPRAAIVLHGREMAASDLSPFAHSLGGDTYFVFPDGPIAGEVRAHAWWPVDSEARAKALAANGPMELSQMDPAGRPEARALLASLVAEVAPSRPYALIGFSQGGMLAMDSVLHRSIPRPSALALLSSTRIALADWTPRASALAGLPVLVTHGHADAELAFAAGEGLRDFATAAGASVTWLPFEGGHDIPLVVWRALRRLLRSLG